MRNDCAVVATVMSVDPDCSPEIAALTGVSAALAISDIPWDGPVGGVNVGLVDDELVINPTLEQRAVSRLNLTVVSTADLVAMIEAGGDEISDELMFEAIMKAHEVNKEIVAFINEIVAQIGKPKRAFESNDPDPADYEMVKEFCLEDVRRALDTDDKTVRDAALLPIYDAVHEKFDEQFEALLEARPAAAIALCGGWREIYGEALEARGIRLLGAATTLREAKVQRSSGVEAVICQGSEAGGPRENFEDDARAMTGLCSLVPQAARATRLPIIAAGGIASPEQAMGLACMGASAVMLGTALAATEESLAPDAYRDRVRYASPSDSVLTDLFSGRTARILRSPLYDALREAGSTALGGYPLPAAVFEPLLAAAKRCGRSDLSAWPAGQSVGQCAWRRTGRGRR